MPKGRLHVPGVLRRLEEEGVDAAAQQPDGLAAEFRRLAKVMPPVTVMVLVVGPMDPATKRGPEKPFAASRATRAAPPR
jgi:hypothetical protein